MKTIPPEKFQECNRKPPNLWQEIHGCDFCRNFRFWWRLERQNLAHSSHYCGQKTRLGDYENLAKRWWHFSDYKYSCNSKYSCAYWNLSGLWWWYFPERLRYKLGNFSSLRFRRSFYFSLRWQLFFWFFLIHLLLQQ